MSEQEIITKLKDKTYVRAFGLMTEEEQEVYRKTGAKNCKVYVNTSCGWLYQNIFDESKTYVIKPDYQPEPEWKCKTCHDTGVLVRTFTGSLGLETNWRAKGSCKAREDEEKPCPDCKPEPEYVDLEIEENEGFLGVWSPEFRITGIIGNSLPHAFTHLHVLPSLPNFEGFWYVTPRSEPNIVLSSVAKMIDEGKTVYARLRNT